MKRGLVPALLLTVAVVGAACGGGDDEAAPSGDTSATGDEQTLRMAFAADMDPPDPDTNYQGQGNQVTTALYEGLLDYAADGSAEIVPLLAESYEVSPDGLTYTFTLRDGVTFHDGTPLTSESLLAGFERRTAEAVDSTMGYMLAPVERYETPDPLTFTVVLSQPESAFLTYLASPFSPKAISPAVLEAEAVDGDEAREYLRTNDAGTGPYTITEFELGRRYVLERYDGWWGPEPYYDRVEISIVPDAANQVVQLEGGDLDIITGQPVATVQTLEDSDTVQVVTFPVLQKAWVHMNPNRAPFDDLAVREAVRAAIDRPTAVEQLFGEYGSVSTQMYPVENVPEGFGTDEWEFDPSLLEELAVTEPVELSFPADSAPSRQAAETIQAQLAEAGLTIELVPLQSADVYALQEHPGAAPHMHFEISYPDSTHPDTWARLFWYSDVASGAGGFLNYLVAGSPESDALLDSGLGAVDQAEVDDAYGRSGDIIYDEVGYITLADVEDVFLVREGISGFAHWLPTPLTLQLKALTAEAG